MKGYRNKRNDYGIRFPNIHGEFPSKAIETKILGRLHYLYYTKMHFLASLIRIRLSQM